MSGAGRPRRTPGTGGSVRQRAVPLVALAAARAPGRLQPPVDVVHPSGAGALVEVVDVLGHDEQVVADGVLEAYERVVRSVGLDPRQRRPPGVVEPLDEAGVVGVRLRGGDLHRVVALPEPARVAERGEPALGGDPGTGQDDDPHAPVLPQSSQPSTRRGARRWRWRAHSGRQAAMTDVGGTSDAVAFVGEWDGPVVATSVHAGHDLRPELAEAMVLDEAERLPRGGPVHRPARRGRSPTDVVPPLPLRGRPQPAPREAVYRKPDDCWGLEVWRDGALSDELVERQPGDRTTTSTTRSAAASTRWPRAARSSCSTCTPTTTGATAPTSRRRPPRRTPRSTSAPAALDRDRFGPARRRGSWATCATPRWAAARSTCGRTSRFEGRRPRRWVHERYPRVGLRAGAGVQEDLHGRVDRRARRRPRRAAHRSARRGAARPAIELRSCGDRRRPS